jgi:ABC-type Fe3+-siderophore transport system permease subunit
LLGNCWLDRADLSEGSLGLVLLTASVSGFTPWCVKWVMEKKQLLATQLQQLTAQSLLKFVMAYAICNALAHQLVWWAMKRPSTNPWVDVWPMFVGDAVGALVILYTLKLMLPALFGLSARFKLKPQARTKPADR